MRRDIKTQRKSPLQRYLENKDKPLWERIQSERAYARELAQEAAQKRETKKAEREEKKRKAKEEQEFIEQAGEAAVKVIEKEIKKFQII